MDTEMEKRLVGLYSRLLAWLPRSFRDEFAEEMVQVLTSRVRESGLCGSRAVLRTFVGELLALPGLWLHAHRRERRKEGERRIFIVSNSDSSVALSGRASSSWGAALVAVLPLVGFPVTWFMAGTVRRLLGAVHLDILYRLLWADAMRGSVMPMVFYLLLLVANAMFSLLPIA